MHSYDRHNPIYPQDRITVIKPSSTMNGSIKEISSSGNKSVRSVDGAIQVESVDQRTRECAQNYFQNKQDGAETEASFHNTRKWKGITATVLMAAGSAATAALATPLAATALIATVALPITLGSVRHSYRASKSENEAIQESSNAEKMKLQWTDPVLKIVENRIRTKEQGFSYAFDHQLKNNALHKEEVRDLWFDALREQGKKLQTGNFSVAQVFADNLLGSKKMTYAIRNVEIQPNYNIDLIEASAGRYQALRSDYAAFLTAMDGQLSILDSVVDSQINAIEAEKNHWLRPINHTRAVGHSQANHYRDELLRPYKQERDDAQREIRRFYSDPRERQAMIEKVEHLYKTDPAVVGIERDYQRDLSTIDAIYSEGKRSLFAHFYDQKQQVHALASNCKSVIQSQEKAGIEQFAEPLRKIFLSRNERDLNRIQTPYLNTEARWVMPPRTNASWSDFHSRFNYQEGLLDITHDAWNIFFGSEGLPSYYRVNHDQWDNFRPSCDFSRNFRMNRFQSQRPLRGCYNQQPPVQTRPEPVRPPIREHAKPGVRTTTGYGSTHRR